MPQSTDLTRLRAEYARREQSPTGADTYSLFNPAHLFAVQQRQQAVLAALRQHAFYPLGQSNILELGCGAGGVLLELLSYGAAPRRLHGLDLLPHRLAQARLILPTLSFICADGQHLPYPSGTFDLILQYTVFSSVLDPNLKANLAQDLLRVLKPNGLILWYDFWINPTNPHTRGIRPPEIRQLFAGCRFQFQRITLAPPIARRLVPVSQILCKFLEKLKLFNSHYLVTIRPISSSVIPTSRPVS